MDFSNLNMSFDEVKAFVMTHQMKLESTAHQKLTNEQMLVYIKENMEKIVCRPIYYYGDVITSIHIEESIANRKVVSYWNVIGIIG